MELPMNGFKIRHPTILRLCKALAAMILCFGAMHRPLSVAIRPIQGKHIPRHLRSLGSSSSRRKVNSIGSEISERFGSCASVPYGSRVFEADADPRDLPLNELMLHLDHPAYVSSPNPDGPVIVDIGLYVHGISDLDPGSNTFAMEGYLDLVWCDARTKFNSTNADKDVHVYLEKDAEKELEEIWWPAVTLVNEAKKRVVENQELLISADGTIEYREKFYVTLASRYDMKRFPFDKQVLLAEIESFAWNSDYLQFHIEDDLVGFSEDFDIPEHRLTEIHEHLETVMEARDRHPFSELVTEIHVLRNPTYYLTKVVIPLTLIVCISWAVFWMESDALADRMAISFTGVLTSVAYQFIVSDILPRHIYNTFLDNFVLLSFIVMNLTVVVNIAVHSLFHRGQARNAALVDKVSQLVFPALFFASAFILAGAQIMVEDFMSEGAVVGLSVCLILACACLLGCLVYRYVMKHPQRDDEDLGRRTDARNNMDKPSFREETEIEHADKAAIGDCEAGKRKCTAAFEEWSSFVDIKKDQFRQRHAPAVVNV